MSETIQLTPEQQVAIGEIERNLQIIACAGSGKTEVITRRIANIIQSKPDIKPANIVDYVKQNNLMEVCTQIQLHKIIWNPNERGV